MTTVNAKARPQPKAMSLSLPLSRETRLAKSGNEYSNSEVASRIAALTANHKLKSDILKKTDIGYASKEAIDGVDAADVCQGNLFLDDDGFTRRLRQDAGNSTDHGATDNAEALQRRVRTVQTRVNQT